MNTLKTFIASFLIGGAMATVFGLLMGFEPIEASVIGGQFAFALAIAMAFFVYSMDKSKTPGAITEAPANIIRGIEGVGGKLILKEDELAFIPHEMNIQKEELHVPYNQIADARLRNTLWVIPNGLLVEATDGTRHRFILWNRKEMRAAILKKIGKPTE